MFSDRALDSLGQGSLLRSLDSLGDGNFLRHLYNSRALDSLGGGAVLRQTKYPYGRYFISYFFTFSKSRLELLENFPMRTSKIPATYLFKDSMSLVKIYHDNGKKSITLYLSVKYLNF